MSNVRVLVADDSPLAREAVISILAQDPDFAVVGEAADGHQALTRARELLPDLILMDINMPGTDGLLATRLIRRELPHVTVVMLTVSDDARDLFEAIKSGAQGYLLKNLEPGDWLAYLRGLMQGDWEMPREMANRILAEFAAPAPAPIGAEASDGLTVREAEVLHMVAQAATNREIAQTLCISEYTVKNHIKNILEKLQMRNRVELALYAKGRFPPAGKS